MCTALEYVFSPFVFGTMENICKREVLNANLTFCTAQSSRILYGMYMLFKKSAVKD
jgi:hypothetical protein